MAIDSGGKDMILVYHKVSLDHVMEGPCDFAGGSPSW